MVISIVVICVVSFIFWMWYELKHPMDAEDEHEEAVKFREGTTDRRPNKSLTENN